VAERGRRNELACGWLLRLAIPVLGSYGDCCGQGGMVGCVHTPAAGVFASGAVHCAGGLLCLALFEEATGVHNDGLCVS
jgi:hypothetical protein